METTRVIIKNLSRTCTADDLRKAVKNMSITDARVVASKNGASRRFGFIGFKSSEDARSAIQLLNKTYIGTSKVIAEFALPVGDEHIPAGFSKKKTNSKREAPTHEKTLTPEEEEGVLDHGRILVTNLPHAATKEEIESFFSSQFGAVREVHIVMDEDLGRPRGMGFVTFVFPRDALRAIREGDMQIFQGRLIRIAAAIEKPQRQAVGTEGGKMTDFQAKRLEKKRAEATSAVHTWNLLYVSANAAASALVDQMNGDLERSDLLLGSSAKDDVAVKAAIAETEIVVQTREWLRQNGIEPSAFERTGTSVLTASTPADRKRSSDTLIIKHLPVDVETESLRFMFTRNGETLVRFLLAPSRTVAIAHFADSGSAKRSFNANAFRKYKSVPLYIEWAPESIFLETHVDQEEHMGDERSATERHEENKTDVSDDPKEQPVKVKPTNLKLDVESVQTSRLCVRNVAFEATSKDIRKLFAAYGRVVSVRLPLKMAAAGDATTGLRKQHRGFAFVEFTSRAEMIKAYEALQSTHLYGRKLVLEPAALEDGSVEAARTKAQRRGDLASGTVNSESKRRKIEHGAVDGGDDDEAFDELLM
jgi:multiple RNA-binding domain-containing protein 1